MCVSFSSIKLDSKLYFYYKYLGDYDRVANGHVGLYSYVLYLGPIIIRKEVSSNISNSPNILVQFHENPFRLSADVSGLQMET
jgi:hypothetical protein